MLTLAAFAVILSIASPIQAQSTTEPVWTPGINLTVGGGGATTVSGDTSTAVGANVGLSYEGLADVPLEVGVRQSFNYANADGASFGGSTEFGLDLNFYASRRFAVFTGFATGIRYADGEDLVWYGGPEGGVKVYLFRDVFVLGRVNYDLAINGRDSNEGDSVRYLIALGVKW
jgi:hypothetical protein